MGARLPARHGIDYEDVESFFVYIPPRPVLRSVRGDIYLDSSISGNNKEQRRTDTYYIPYQLTNQTTTLIPTFQHYKPSYTFSPARSRRFQP